MPFTPSGTGTTMLFDSGTPEAIIQKHTGHRSLSALRMYKRVTPQQQAMVSNILANTPSPESEQANTSKANTTLNSSGCSEEASTSFNLSGCEFDPDTSYSADDLEVFLNLTKMEI